MRGTLGAVIGAAFIVALLGFYQLLGGVRAPHPTPGLGDLQIVPIDFSSIEGWREDRVAKALGPLHLSCERYAKAEATAFLRRGHPDHPELARLYGTTADWEPVCADLPTGTVTDDAARSFFETHFIPIQIAYDRGETAKATGYFEPSYNAAKTPQGKLIQPVLRRPADLITLDLGAFRKALRGQRLAGKLRDGKLIPYGDHRMIATATQIPSDIIAYVDPNDLLFLQIQGSGRLVFPDGTILRVGYAAQNGHPYVAVGRTLFRQGHLALEDITMASIRSWLDTAAPDAAAEIRYSNPSYVFFRVLDELPDAELGPLGAQGTQLTPGRSIAIDPRFYPYGAPVWIDVDAEQDAPDGFRHLTIAQDTGGAIRGAQRADVFFGAGERAAARAGALNSEVHLFVLVPKLAWKRFTDEPS
ncbi:MAG: murein transglycosylase A [Parvularcula sp.]